MYGGSHKVMNRSARRPRRLLKILLATALTVGAGSSQAFVLNFDYSYDGGFFSGANQGRQSILEAAGSFFEQRITDQLSAINSGGGNQFDVSFKRPDTGVRITLEGYSVAADTLVIYAGGRELGSTLGTGGPGGFSVSGSSGFVDTAVNRGQGTTQGAAADDFGPWGGAIAFDSVGTNWYFDSDPSTSEGFSGSDFYSVALHEIGHVLGYGTSDSWDNLVVNASTDPAFTGPNATALNGGSNLPLADPGHWQNGWQSTIDGVAGSEQEVAMDPSLTTGHRKVFTDLDLAGLQDIGWDVSPVPVPAAVYLFGSGLIGFLGLARRRRG